ncbi:MAG: ribbon-helix-helix domain-containing protein [Egibacteraceae bacterium]
MTTAKIAVSLPSELLADVRRLVAHGHAPSVSAYVAEALREKVTREDLLVLLDELLQETGGPVTDAERAEINAEIDAELGGPGELDALGGLGALDR